MRITAYDNDEPIEARLDEIIEQGQRVERIVNNAHPEMNFTAQDLIAKTRVWGNGTKSENIVAPMVKVIRVHGEERKALFEFLKKGRQEMRAERNKK